MAGITAVLADQLQMVRVISYILRAQEQLDSLHSLRLKLARDI